MKSVMWFGLLALMSASVFAQRGSGAAHSGGGMRSGAGRGASASGGFRGTGAGRLNQRSGFFPYLLLDGDYDYAYPPYEPASFPNTIVVQPVQPVPAPSAHAGPAVVHNYSTGAGTPGAEQPTFVVAMVDGSRVEASAVWTQDGFLHFIDRDDNAHRVLLGSVDRALTRKLNQDRNLNLRIPQP